VNLINCELKSVGLAVTALLLTACSSTAKITVINPAINDRAAATKVVAVLPFENDYSGVANSVESRVTNHRVAGEIFFTVVNRNDLESILDEQKLQHSGLVDEKTSVEIGQLIGAKGLITGEVEIQTTDYSLYYVTRVECADKKCNKTRERYIPCDEMHSNLQATIRLVDTERGDLILSERFTAKDSHDACRDSAYSLPTPESALSKLADEITDEFMTYIAPYEASFVVQLLDDPEIDYNSEQENLLDYGIEYVEDHRIDKAESLFSELLTSTGDQCYVAAYNLAVVKEQLGKTSQAEQLYRLADQLVKEPNKIINQAILRIELQKSEQARLETQL